MGMDAPSLENARREVTDCASPSFLEVEVCRDLGPRIARIRVVAINEGLCGPGDPRSLGSSVFNTLCYFRNIGLDTDLGTDRSQSTTFALRISRCANAAAVQNQAQTETNPILAIEQLF